MPPREHVSSAQREAVRALVVGNRSLCQFERFATPHVGAGGHKVMLASRDAFAATTVKFHVTHSCTG